MSYDVEVVEVEAVPFAYVARQGRRNQIGEIAMATLDVVWRTVREAGLETGHNVFVYRPAGDGLLDMEFGVQVAQGAELSEGEVVIGLTPAGRALHTTHTGSYDRLGDAWDAVYTYATQHGLPHEGPGWEVYGDWTDDLTRLETDVYVLVPSSSA